MTLPASGRRLHDWACHRLRQARLRARAAREQTWRQRLRRALRELVVGYVLLNLLLVHLVPFAVTGALECHVLDATTSRPVVGAAVTLPGRAGTHVVDGAGTAVVQVHAAAQVWWALPCRGQLGLGGVLQVAAAGYRPIDVPLPERFDWPWSGAPRTAVTVRLHLADPGKGR